jgi:hypothetical protein
MLVLGAGTAAGAWATERLPEFGSCEAAPGHEGKYADAGCTLPVAKVYGKYNGSYEWHTGGLEGYNFEGGKIGPATFETTSGRKIACSGGELYQLQIEGSTKVRKILSIFYGCEAEGQPCSSKFQSEGEISDEMQWLKGEAFKGELVYLSGKKTTTPTVGLTLTSFTQGAPLFTVVCEGSLGTVEIGGAGGKKTEKSKGNAVVSVISPIDQMVGEGEPTSAFTQTFAQTSGVQEPAGAEKGKAKSLQMYLGNENRWVQMGMGTTFQDTPEDGSPPVEIKAVQ